MASWRIEHRQGSAEEFHSRDLAEHRSATFFTTGQRTLVLGSSQRSESVDADEAARRGIDIVRRRSGGGGVLLLPGEYVWLDLEIPASDVLWSDDVGRAMWWVGDLWRTALEPILTGATVHRGRLQRTPWSAQICFAGVGPGEVMVGDAKVVGVSQRRTRGAARFQSMVHLAWRPEVVVALLVAPLPTEPLTPVVTCPGPADVIAARLAEALTHL